MYGPFLIPLDSVTNGPPDQDVQQSIENRGSDEDDDDEEDSESEEE